MLFGCSEEESNNSIVEVEKETDNSVAEVEKGSVTILFPFVDSVTTASNITIRGKASGNVNDLQVNGVIADTTTFSNEGFWTAEIPLTHGDNLVTVIYNDDSGANSVVASSIRRNSYFLNSPEIASYASDVNKLFIFNQYDNSIFSVDIQNETIEFVYQNQVDNFPDNELYRDEMHEQDPDSVVVSKDGNTLYYLTKFNSQIYINSLDTRTSELTTIYSPDTVGYIAPTGDFDEKMPLLLDEINNQLIITSEQKSSTLYSLNLASDPPTVTNLTLNGLPTFDNFLHWAIKDTTHFTFIANDGSQYFTGDVEISSGVYSNGSGLNSKIATCPDLDTGSSFTYQTGTSTFFWSDGNSDDSNICLFNTASMTEEDITEKIQGYPDFKRFSSEYLFSTSEHLYIAGQAEIDFQLVQFTNKNGSYDYHILGDELTVGDPNIKPTTARKVLLDKTDDKAYYIIRRGEQNLYSQLYELNLNSQFWRHIGTYTDVTFAKGILDMDDNALYLINDDGSSDNELYRVNIDSGAATVIIGPSDKAALVVADFDIIDLAFNHAKKVIYLAREINSSVPAGYDALSILAWDIESQSLTEQVSNSNINTDEDLLAGYGMAYDPQQHQIIFPSLRDQNSIWAINLDSGERSLISSDATHTGPTTNTIRDITIDMDNNIALAVSQNSESLIKIDLTSGNRTIVSPEDHHYGVVFAHPSGIDLDSFTQLALVADDTLDAIFLVDLLTQQRVIIQH